MLRILGITFGLMVLAMLGSFLNLALADEGMCIGKAQKVAERFYHVDRSQESADSTVRTSATMIEKSPLGETYRIGIEEYGPEGDYLTSEYLVRMGTPKSGGCRVAHVKKL